MINWPCMHIFFFLSKPWAETHGSNWVEIMINIIIIIKIIIIIIINNNK
jgi:hypothetical protein